MQMQSGRVALDKIYKRRDRYEIPDWQREGDVWTPAKNSQLIDSVLRGWKLPKFYFLRTAENPEIFEVVDGQQRLGAIWGFFAGEVALDKAGIAEHGAASYAELEDGKSDAFDDFEIDYDMITEADDEEIRDFFQRLQSGLPLNSSERLNAVPSKLRDFCAKTSEHAFFAEKTTIPPRRYAYFDVCAKVMAVELEGTEAGLRFEDLEPLFKEHKAFSGTSSSATRVTQALDWLTKHLSDQRPNLRSRAVVQTLVNVTTHLIESGVTQKQVSLICEEFDLFFADLTREVERGQSSTRADLMLFQATINSNRKSGATTRSQILLRHLIRTRPELFSAGSASASLNSGLSDQVGDDGDRAAALIHRVNLAHAAQVGGDLFKPTNQTVKAQNLMRKPVSTKSDYDALVSALYHLFREGPGNRLQTWPPSFQDVNDLRTLAQHDVDHGKGAQAKRSKLSATFKTYSGTTSPDAASPMQLLVAQANLLSKLCMDLEGLEAKFSA